MSGVVAGGWNYVIAAYSITAVVLLVYGVTLVTRLREAASHLTKGRQPE